MCARAKGRCVYGRPLIFENGNLFLFLLFPFFFSRPLPLQGVRRPEGWKGPGRGLASLGLVDRGRGQAMNPETSRGGSKFQSAALRRVRWRSAFRLVGAQCWITYVSKCGDWKYRPCNERIRSEVPIHPWSRHLSLPSRLGVGA